MLDYLGVVKPHGRLGPLRSEHVAVRPRAAYRRDGLSRPFRRVDLPALGFPTTVRMPARVIGETYRMQQAPVDVVRGGLSEGEAGGGLLSRALSSGVPSAL